jgi:DNA-directed RNA polymerase subunit RPC12/RpoP
MRTAIVMGSMDYFFYRCHRCARLITILEEKAEIRKGLMCPCGSLNYKPTNLLWYDWLKPKVWRVTIVRMLGGFDETRSGYTT